MARAWLASRATAGRLACAALAVHEGLWLGGLSAQSLEALDEVFYSTDGEVYAGDGYVRSGLSEWEQEFVDRHISEGRIGVAAAGAGREVLALLQQGHDAVGFEPHSAMVARGVQILDTDGWPGRLERVERSTWPEGAGPFEAVIVGWGGYMLMPDRATRVRFLSQVRQTVPAGAPVLLSFFARDQNARTDLIVSGTAALTVRILSRLGLGATRPISVGDRLWPNLVHFFDEMELRAELGDAGFLLDSYEAEPYGHAVGIAV